MCNDAICFFENHSIGDFTKLHFFLYLRFLTTQTLIAISQELMHIFPTELTSFGVIYIFL